MKLIQSRLIIIFAVFMTFLFAPLEIFFSNRAEFWFSARDILPYLICGAIATLLFAFLVDCFATRKDISIWGYIKYYVFTLFLILYVQGTYMFSDYGQFDGQPIAWDKFKTQGFVSVGVALVIVLVATILLVRFKISKILDVANIVSGCILLVQLITLSIVVVAAKDARVDTNYVVTNKNYTKYSSTDNFIILTLDAFDSRVLYDLYNGNSKELVEETLENFTFYHNTSNVMLVTELSVPHIITGEKYLNQQPFWDYLNDAYAASPLLNNLQARDYSLNIYTNINIPQGMVADKVDNWASVDVSVSSHRVLLGYVYKLVGFRYLPQPFKKYCWFYSDDMFNLQDIKYDDEYNDSDGVYTWGNIDFLEKTDEITADTSKPVFHFFHLKGMHVPRDYDEFFNYFEGEDVGLEETGCGILMMLHKYFDKLKELGVYDDAIIVLVADHGSREYDEKKIKKTPILLVKGKQEKHSLEISELPVSFDDLQSGYKNLIDGALDIFEIPPDRKERYLYTEDWSTNTLTKKGTGSEVFYENVFSGKSYEYGNISLTGKTFEY